MAAGAAERTAAVGRSAARTRVEMERRLGSICPRVPLCSKPRDMETDDGTSCYHAIMGKHANSSVHYTIRGVPAEVDHALRVRAAQQNQSLNRVVLDELTRALIGKPVKAALQISLETGFQNRSSIRTSPPSVKLNRTTGNPSCSRKCNIHAFVSRGPMWCNERVVKRQAVGKMCARVAAEALKHGKG